MWWKPETFEKKRPYLEARGALIRSVRDFFDQNGFYEVETPILQVSPVMDTHIHALKTDLRGVDLAYEKTLWLHTSPEFAMKKLLVAGLPKIYQICHVFRDAEGSRRHSREFTMIEWYRAHDTYETIMTDCIGLLRHCAAALGIRAYRHQDAICDPFAEWEIITVAQAFKKYAGLDIEVFLPQPPASRVPPSPDGRGCRSEAEAGEGKFAQAVRSLGLHTAPDDRWDDLFFRVMGEKIEPHLGMDRPTVIKDYPAAMASLSRRKPDDPRFAERFEMYVCGVELCNAFGELTDAAEQRKRFIEEMEAKQKLYGESYPIDEDFLAALEHGLPESGGNALGLDRLAMLATGADDIEQVLWAGKV